MAKTFDEHSEQGIAGGADNIVLAGQGKQMRILLVTRKYSPYQNELALPGGYCDKGERPLTTALRELTEECQLRLSESAAIPLTPRRRPGRDPRGKSVAFPFLFWLETAPAVHGGDDAKDAQWYLLKDVPRLAFDHGAILCEALGKFWPTFPSAVDRLSHVQSPLPVLKEPGPVTFFGGSFNPWHEGHSVCLDLFPQKDQLVVVPDQNPFKPLPGETSHFCHWQKFREILDQALKWQLKVYPGFWGMESPNPTASWLPFVVAEEKSFLLGADSFLKISTWSQADLLLKSLSALWVVPRAIDESLEREAQKRILEKYPHLKIHWLPHHPFEQLSSSRLRE